jgi:hypothetical protein
MTSMYPHRRDCCAGEVIDEAVLQLARSTPSTTSSATSAGEAASSSSSADSSSNDAAAAGTVPSTASGRNNTANLDVLSAATWPGVLDWQVLLHPHDVRTTWREFMSYSNVSVQQALSAQQANRLANNRLPPLWALGLMLVLGWNEAMAVLFNPLYLVLVVVGGLFIRR